MFLKAKVTSLLLGHLPSLIIRHLRNDLPKEDLHCFVFADLLLGLECFRQAVGRHRHVFVLEEKAFAWMLNFGDLGECEFAALRKRVFLLLTNALVVRRAKDG